MNESAGSSSDAELVRSSLSGEREAFAQIVSRYQALVCSIAYSATGNLSQSEDLAQETFVAAWRSLRELRDASLLRSWLSGIARNLAHQAHRRSKHDAIREAGSLEHIVDAPAPEPQPVDQAISREEEGILWRSLQAIPETYREPLILFYRQHQSVERVASSLGLSEELVRQRLARGRKALAEQVLAFVEGTLQKSGPGRGFTLGVVAALPPLASTTAIAGATGAAAKSGFVAKSALFGALLSSLFGFFSGGLGAWFGLRMGLDLARSPAERALVIRAWVITVCGAVVFTAATYGLILPRAFWFRHLTALTVCAAAVPVLFSVWLVHTVARTGKLQRAMRSAKRIENLTAANSLDRTSRIHILGLPLWKIRLETPAEDAPPVIAWITFGDRAIGLLFAGGTMAMGTISVGGVSVGIISLGCVSAGVISIGTVALGVLVLATIGAGIYGMGAVAFAWKAASGAVAIAHGLALGNIAIGDRANDEVVVEFFTRVHADSIFHALIALTFLLLAILILWTRLYLRHSRARRGSEQP